MNAGGQMVLIGLGCWFFVGMAEARQLCQGSDARGVVHMALRSPSLARDGGAGPRIDRTGGRPTDTEIEKILVGRWEGVDANVRGVNDYRAGGALIVAGAMATSAGTRTFALTGRWHVENGHIVAVLETSSIPDVLRPGLVTRDYVLSIDERVLRSRSESGKISVRHRLSGR